MSQLTKTELGMPSGEDTIRIKGNTLSIEATVVNGQEGDIYVSIVPSLMVSGYGSTPEEATESLDVNMEAFCEDFMNLPAEQRKLELVKLGFAQVPYHSKNYSKLYVDENGLLQGLENVTVKKNKQFTVAC